MFSAIIASKGVSAEPRASSAPKLEALKAAFIKTPLHEDPYVAASKPKRIVSVSRRSVSFYNDSEESLDHGHMIGAAFVKRRPIDEDRHNHKSD